MKKLLRGMFCLLAILSAGSMALANSVTGNPAADGWTLNGNSLANGVYVRGSANYSYNTYFAAMTVQAASNLAIADGDNSWLAGDTVLGVGGHFVDITAAEAGWSAFTGNAVNLLLGGTDAGADVKLQAKFGTRTAVDAASFAASAVAPDAGNGLGGFGANGGTGAVQIRTSAWFYADQWIAGSGALQLLNAADHIERNGTTTPDADVARLMWIWDPASQRVGTWEILLNTSLMDRLNPSFTDGTPAAEDLVLMTVQNRDNSYTDARVVGVPEPSMLAFLGALAVGLFVHVRRRR